MLPSRQALRTTTLSSVIDPATVLAYRQSEYRVFGSVPIVLQVDVKSVALLILYRTYQTHCSAFITACNPLGKRLEDVLNSRRQEALAIELARQGRVMLAGIGQHPSGEWAGEPSYLVLGLAREAAQDLGRHFEQNAIIWAGGGAIPELILLR